MVIPSLFFDCFTNATEDGGLAGLSLKKTSMSAHTPEITQLWTNVICLRVLKQLYWSVLSIPADKTPLITRPATLPSAIDRPISPVAVAR